MVLTPLKKYELEKIFDKYAEEVLKFYIKKAIISQPELLEGQKDTSFQVPKEHIEQWIVQAIGGEYVGAGSYPIDIVHNKYGIDVKSLVAKTNELGELTNLDSGETSLAQKFTDSGDNLDDLFKSKNYEKMVNGWNKILYEKLNKVYKEKSLEKIYYFFILRAKNHIHLCGVEVNAEKIENVKYLKATNDSVFVSGIIDEKFGNAKIYKAKKRLELRLKPKYFYDNGYTLDFDLDFTLKIKNIRDLIKNDKLNTYKKELCDLLMK